MLSPRLTWLCKRRWNIQRFYGCLALWNLRNNLFHRVKVLHLIHVGAESVNTTSKRVTTCSQFHRLQKKLYLHCQHKFWGCPKPTICIHPQTWGELGIPEVAVYMFFFYCIKGVIVCGQYEDHFLSKILFAIRIIPYCITLNCPPKTISVSL